MRKEWLLLAALPLFFVACDSKSTSSMMSSPTEDVDNTGRNVRDRNMNTVTSGDQSESKQDLAITQDIRQRLMASDSLSTNAKNIKIITIDGVVTLRGVVNSTEEKEFIFGQAQQVQGTRTINNLIEVKKSF